MCDVDNGVDGDDYDNGVVMITVGCSDGVVRRW